MMVRHLLFLSCALVLIGLLAGCSGRKSADQKPWDFPWKNSENPAIDGRDLLGVYDLKDPQTNERFQVFLLYDNNLRDGSYNPAVPYTVFAFYSTDGKAWQSQVVADGTQCIGLSEQGRTETFVLLNAQPYYEDYAEDGDPLREQVHQPRPVTLTIREGKPSLDWQGPPDWEVQTRRAPYHRHGTVFTGTIKSGKAWGFASYTEELPMTYYYLQLDRPVIFDKNLSERDPAEEDQRELHLLLNTDKLYKQAQASVGQRVTVVGSCFHSHTAHHRRSVVVSVDMMLGTPAER